MMKFLHVAVLAAIFVKCVSASAFSETDLGKAIKEGRLGIAGSISQTGQVDMWTPKNFATKDQETCNGPCSGLQSDWSAGR